MKLLKLNAAGLSHYILPALVVTIVGATGVKVLSASHADSPRTVTLAASSSATTATPKVAAILGVANTAAGTTNVMSSIPYSYIGSQMVSFVGPGQSLSYTNGLKGNETTCYEVYVTQPKTGTATATVEFANNNNSVSTTLSSTLTNNLQQVCVAPGTKVNPGFNVKNTTPATQGTNIEVLQAIITQ